MTPPAAQVLNELVRLQLSLAEVMSERHQLIERRRRLWAQAHDAGESWMAISRASGVSDALVRREASALP